MKGLLIHFRPTPGLRREAGWYSMSAFSNSSPILGLAPAQLGLGLYQWPSSAVEGLARGCLVNLAAPLPD